MSSRAVHIYSITSNPMQGLLRGGKLREDVAAEVKGKEPASLCSEHSELLLARGSSRADLVHRQKVLMHVVHMESCNTEGTENAVVDESFRGGTEYFSKRRCDGDLTWKNFHKGGER